VLFCEDRILVGKGASRVITLEGMPRTVPTRNPTPWKHSESW